MSNFEEIKAIEERIRECFEQYREAQKELGEKSIGVIDFDQFLPTWRRSPPISRSLKRSASPTRRSVTSSGNCRNYTKSSERLEFSEHKTG